MPILSARIAKSRFIRLARSPADDATGMQV